MPFPRSGKIAAWALSGLLATFSLLLWLLGTESALHWSARQAERLSGGRLVLHAVHGSLYGPLRIEALNFEDGEMRYQAKEVKLDWSPRSLLRRQLRIDSLTLQELRIAEIKPSAAPAALPQTLRLPLTLSAPAIALDRLVYEGQELRGIDLGLEKPGASYRLDLRGIAGEWGKGQAEMTLDDTFPFKLSAHATLAREEGWAYRAEADVSGDLSKVNFKARANTLGGKAHIDAQLTPFGTFPLAAAHLQADGIDPALLRKDLPHAALGADISLKHKKAGGLEGRIALSNGMPGGWDASRLPLREMTAQFSGTPERLDLRAIRLDLAGGGELKGEGRIGRQGLRLDLATSNLDPHGLYGKLRAMRLGGTIHLLAEAESQQLSADLRYKDFQLHLDARHQDASIKLRQAKLQSGAGSLDLHGTLALQDPKPFQLAGTLQGFNPADFGSYPPARINASLSATGQIAAEPQAVLEFSIAGSRFRSQPLSGQGKLNISAARIWDSEAVLRLAGNRLELKGALGEPGDRLGFRIEASDLSMLDPGLGGKVNATGTLEGRFSAPSGSLDAQASSLSWRQYRLDSLSAKGKLDKGGNGPLSLEASLRGLATPQLQLERGGLGGQGTRARHSLKLHGKNKDFDLESHFSGGWDDTSGWSGQVTGLVNRGRHALALKSPAQLEVARQHLLLKNARFDFVGADFALRELAYDNGRIASNGEFKGLPLAYLQKLAEQDAALRADLSLGGEWRFVLADNVNGHAAIWREHGDVPVFNDPRIAFGLTRLGLNVDILNNRLQARLEAAGAKLGSLGAEAQSTLSARDGAWGFAGDAPLQASLDLAVPSLAWMQPIIDKSGALNFDGALKAQVRAGGTFARPALAGGISGEGFSLALPEQGLNLTQGRFEAELRDQALHLKSLTLRGGDGSLSGQGSLALEDDAPLMQLTLKADRLELLSRPDRHLILSGTGDLSATGRKVHAAARLKADRGLIELPKGDTPALSDDVVVLGRNGALVKKKSSPYALSYELDLDLGERFFVKAKGLDAQLGGTLRLSGAEASLPSSRGTIRVVKGGYAAYGQHLAIERGLLNFQGPVDNPGLDIVALRKNQPVEAGVSISGTAQSPRVKLVSNPTVPDGEKLSWLLFGHGLDDSSGQEFGALQAAAGTLLAAGESVTLQQRIAHAAGLEEVSLKGAGELEGTVLALGKRLSSRAYLSYEQGLGGAGTLVKVNYTLTKRLSVSAQAGATPAVDLFYTFSFD